MTLEERLAAQATVALLKPPDLVIFLTTSGREVGRRVVGEAKADSYAPQALQQLRELYCYPGSP